jgi:nitroreductase
MATLPELIYTRQSVRRYDSRTVPEALIRSCIEAARMSPSASNSQPWSFVVVQEPELVKAVAHATYDSYIPFNKFVPQAPVIVALVIEKLKLITRIGKMIKDRDFQWTDHGIAASQFCLMAAHHGLGTCMLGWFNEPEVKKLLKIPAGKRLSMLITLGYPPEGYSVRKKIRKPFEEIVFDNYYGMPMLENGED